MKRITLIILATFTMLTACTLPNGMPAEESSEISESSESPIVPEYKVFNTKTETGFYKPDGTKVVLEEKI